MASKLAERLAGELHWLLICNPSKFPKKNSERGSGTRFGKDPLPISREEILVGVYLLTWVVGEACFGLAPAHVGSRSHLVAQQTALSLRWSCTIDVATQASSSLAVLSNMLGRSVIRVRFISAGVYTREQ